jgi:hypothetical protein
MAQYPFAGTGEQCQLQPLAPVELGLDGLGNHKDDYFGIGDFV